MAQNKINAPVISPIEAARAVLGRNPEDALVTIQIGVTTLDQLEALFRAIEAECERNNPSSIDIRRLAALGRYVASDICNTIDCEREEIADSIKAAEAQE